MNKALESILTSHPASDSGAVWKEAIIEAVKLPLVRSGKEDPAKRLMRLRDTLKGELVAFHDKLIVTPGSAVPGNADGRKLWKVQVPLTLFPKRDRGFTRMECIIEFRSDAEEIPGFRIVELLPKERTVVLAQGMMGGDLQLNTSVGMKLPLALPTGVSVVDAQAKVYGQAGAKFEYKAERSCVLAEIVRGTGARWRLDDLQNPKMVGAESHQLEVVLEVGPETPPVHAAGYLNAYSEEQWMTQPISDLLGKITHNLLNFFKKGAPSEAYAEWQNILAS